MDESSVIHDLWGIAGELSGKPVLLKTLTGGKYGAGWLHIHIN